MSKYFKAKNPSFIIEQYHQNALDAWQAAITKATELKKAAEWLQQTVEGQGEAGDKGLQRTIPLQRTISLQRSVPPHITNENTNQTPSDIVNKNRSESQAGTTPWSPRAAWGSAGEWAAAQKKAQKKVKDLAIELQQAVVGALDGSKDWVVTIILNLQSKSQSKLQSRSLPKVLPDCADMIKQCIEMGSQIKKIEHYLTTSESLLGVKGAIKNNEKMINWVKDSIINELGTIKLQPQLQTPRDSASKDPPPKTLMRAIDMVQDWFNAQKKIEDLINAEGTPAISDLARQAFDEVVRAHDTSREVADLSPRLVVV